MNRKYYILIISLFLSASVSSQWSCPSKLNARLKPFWNDGPLSWSMELEGGGGVLGERVLSNGMGLGALEFYVNNFVVYAEGGVKYWNTVEEDLNLSNSIFGMRELYFNTFKGNRSFKLGLQSLQLQDMFVINERALAGYYKWNDNGVVFEAALGTVSDEFARNGTFCSKCFQYDIVMDRKRPYLAGSPFKEKFSALVLTFQPGKIKSIDKTTSEITSGSDEFETFDEFDQQDEFKATDDFGPVDEFGSFSADPERQPLMTVEKYGLLAYAEYGDFYNTTGFWFGFFEEITIPFQITYRGEYLLQQHGKNFGIVSVSTFSKMVSSGIGFTDFNIGYYDFWRFDGRSEPMLSYTNLFLGEVLRMDYAEYPLLSAFVKHRFKGHGFSLKLQYATSFSEKKMTEYDMQFNSNIGKNLHLIATLGYIEGTDISKNMVLARAEMRLTF